MHSIFLHYPVNVPTKQVPNMPYETFEDATYYYFIIPAPTSEKYVYEIYSISQHFHQQGWTNLLCPLFNIHNQFITTIENKTYILCYAHKISQLHVGDKTLANFHLTGLAFPYQPRLISNYGKWQELWITKMDQYEAYYQHLWQLRPMSSMVREVLDFFPYIIGLAENAIQYMHIIHKETQFNDHDQPTITFGRYHDQINQPFIWSHQLVYDHPARDLAEKLRPLMKKKGGLLLGETHLFLQEYFQSNPMSIFGWKLLFCRLLFPIHLLEFVDHVRNDDVYHEGNLQDIIQEQINYEENLNTFFTQLGIDKTSINHIQLDWLMK